jgi:hypothetical protein
VLSRLDWLQYNWNFNVIHLYFRSANSNNQQIIAPTQYDGTINYISVKLNKEYRFGKFGFDNTILFQGRPTG